MKQHPNLRSAINMLEKIVERSGEDRATVFLDIIIQLIFAGQNTPGQQAMMNRIAALYEIEPTYLKDKTEDDVAF